MPALCKTLLGRWAEVIAHTFSLLVLTGANIVYWILIANFLYFTVNYLLGELLTYLKKGNELKALRYSIYELYYNYRFS